MRINRTGPIVVIGVVLAACVALSLPRVVAAQNEATGRVCTNATLRGTYVKTPLPNVVTIVLDRQ